MKKPKETANAWLLGLFLSFLFLAAFGCQKPADSAIAALPPTDSHALTAPQNAQPIACAQFICQSSMNAKVNFINALPGKLKVILNGQTVLDECLQANTPSSDENYVYRISAHELQTGRNFYKTTEALPDKLTLQIQEIKSCQTPEPAVEIFSVNEAQINYIEQFKKGDPCYQDCRMSNMDFNQL